MITDKFMSSVKCYRCRQNIDARKSFGDVDYDSVEKIVGAITPVPGGVGL